MPYIRSFAPELIFPSRVTDVTTFDGRTIVICENGVYEVDGLDPIPIRAIPGAVYHDDRPMLVHPTIKGCLGRKADV